MTEDSYKKALEDAIAEYRTLVTQRTEIDLRIAHLRETIVTLLRLLGRQEPVDFENFFNSAELAGVIDTRSEAGLSEAILDTLKAYDGFLTVREIKEGLTKIGFDIERYTDALPSISTTLSRLARNGDILRQEINGVPAYKFNTSPFKHSPLKYIGQRRPKERTPNWMQRLKEAAEKEAAKEVGRKTYDIERPKKKD